MIKTMILTIHLLVEMEHHQTLMKAQLQVVLKMQAVQPVHLDMMDTLDVLLTHQNHLNQDLYQLVVVAGMAAELLSVVPVEDHHILEELLTELLMQVMN